MILLLALACSSERMWPGGTGVGNPGTTRLTMERSSALTIDEASVPFAAWEVETCDGEIVSVDVGRDADLMSPEPDELPGGEWCGLSALFDGPLHLVARAEKGEPGKATVDLLLDLGEAGVMLDALEVDGGSWILELHPPSKEAMHGLEDGTHLEVEPGDPDHDKLASAIATTAGLFEDLDENGVLDAQERDEGPLGGSPGGTGDDP
ncbi:MAG: hypothetical protein KC656_21330 [Myxococcales bacterium]|nr:hypothetical protein [Myxococcales bacterium]MCA9570407.1 hypothetical protein [Myxococcales bacterium]